MSSSAPLHPPRLPRRHASQQPAQAPWCRLLAGLLLAWLACAAGAQQPLSGLLAPSGLSRGDAAVVRTEQVRAELLAHAPDGLQPGATVWLGLQLDHIPEWHTYWKNPGDSGLPTELQWRLPDGLTAGDIAWPVPRKFPIGHLANYGYEKKVLLPVPVTVDSRFQPPAGASTVDVRLQATCLV